MIGTRLEPKMHPCWFCGKKTRSHVIDREGRYLVICHSDWVHIPPELITELNEASTMEDVHNVLKKIIEEV